MIARDNRVQQALTYLSETDEPYARAKALVKGCEQARKTVKAIGFLHATGTAGERESTAYSTPEYLDILSKYEEAVYDEALYYNKRGTEALIVEVWRSEGANRRSGNI